MKLFFDTEFTGLQKDTSLISIGIVMDNGNTFYAELTDYNKSQVDSWLQKNVMDNLLFNDRTHFVDYGNHCRMKGTKESLKNELTIWLSQYGKIEVWSDCLAYDWVLFNDIFGDAFKIPKNIHYIPYDICTMFKLAGVDSDINREDYSQYVMDESSKKHNALHDAYVIQACYNKLEKKMKGVVSH